MVANDDIQEALNQYRSRLDIATWCPKCALIDMDGVLSKVCATTPSSKFL